MAHRPADRQRDHGNQPREEFGRRHSEKLWQEYRPGITAAEPPARLSHPPPPGTMTDMLTCLCYDSSLLFFISLTVEIVHGIH